jgi:tRNA (guanosine-2'-O-)-methyltransferase
MPNDPAAARREMGRLFSATTSFDDRWFVHGGVRFSPAEVIAVLEPYLTAARRARIEAALRQRTYNLAVVLEGMVDTGNVAAVMRSCDGFGVQPFHAIDTAGSYKHSKRTSQGAEKWLDVWRWRAPGACIDHLRSAGYRVVAAHVGGGATPLRDVDFAPRTALVFGNELDGLTDGIVERADETAVIPISGFVQSFNVSVAVALFLQRARSERTRLLGRHGDLSPSYVERLRAVWSIKSVRHAKKLLARAAASLDGRHEDLGAPPL